MGLLVAHSLEQNILLSLGKNLMNFFPHSGHIDSVCIGRSSTKKDGPLWLVVLMSRQRHIWP